jgi:Fur family peroxide stress response transcriptional regulator
MDEREIEHRMRRFEETLKQRELKVTHQRMEIYRELASTEEHPEAETVYRRVHRRIPAISRDTVYRTLAFLEELGLVRRAEVRSGPARFDANIDRHHHFVCTSCGLIRDVYSEFFDNLPVPGDLDDIGRVTCGHVQLKGLCRECEAGAH